MTDKTKAARTIYQTEGVIYTISKDNLDSVLNKLWDKTREIVAGFTESRNFASMRLLYKNESASPVGVGSLPYDWAKGIRYQGLDSLKGRRLELFVDAPKNKTNDACNSSSLPSMIVIERKDNNTATAQVNAIFSFINPAPFYQILNEHCQSQQTATKNAQPYVTKSEMNLRVIKAYINDFAYNSKRACQYLVRRAKELVR